jgi:glycine/D-amino acid oxidase-like deaminating enzyme
LKQFAPKPASSQLLPVPNPTTSIWLSDPDKELRKWKSSELPPANATVVIIGSGFAGVSLAYHLLHTYGGDMDIVMLEARETCSGATGRNGGHCFPNLYEGCKVLKEKWGAEEARRQAEFEIANFDEIVDLVKREDVDCDLAVHENGYDVHFDSKTFDRKLRDLEEMRNIGGPVKDVKVFMDDHAARVFYKSKQPF